MDEKLLSPYTPARFNVLRNSLIICNAAPEPSIWSQLNGRPSATARQQLPASWRATDLLPLQPPPPSHAPHPPRCAVGKKYTGLLPLTLNESVANLPGSAASRVSLTFLTVDGTATQASNVVRNQRPDPRQRFIPRSVKIRCHLLGLESRSTSPPTKFVLAGRSLLTKGQLS